MNQPTQLVASLLQLYDYVAGVVLARAQKVTEWKDRKEAILRGEITATEGTADADIDSIYDIQEEASGICYVLWSLVCCIFEIVP